MPFYWYILAPLIAIVGGIFGIFGAFYNELLHGSVLLAFVGAPIIEESLKPSGVYLLLAKWSGILHSQLYTAFLAMLGGIVFALIENAIYLNVYINDPSSGLILWRNTVCVGLHAVCSFIFGLGINEKLKASINGEIKFLSTGKRFFITAMVIHSLYNIAMFMLETREDMW